MLAALACGWLGAVGRAHGAPAEESIDDPKLARRLGTRYAAPLATTAAPATGDAAAGPVPAPVPPTGPAPPSPWVTAPGGPAPPAGDAGPAAVLVAGGPSVDPAFEPSLPRVELAFRRFDFARVGAAGATNGVAASEPFDNLSLDVFALSSIARIGFSTQYGWQEGHRSGGDFLAAESFTAGVQIGGHRVVPFAEGLAGVGYMRRTEFDRSVPTVFWQFGVDLGAMFYPARLGFVSVALGYLRPMNGFAAEQSFASVYTNSFSFKLGIGI